MSELSVFLFLYILASAGILTVLCLVLLAIDIDAEPVDLYRLEPMESDHDPM